MHKLRSYVLPVAILLGLLFHRWCGILAFLSPYLIFTILFLNFVAVDIRQLKITRLSVWFLLIQALVSIGSYYLIRGIFHNELVAQGLLIGILCPVAASVVVISCLLGAKRETVTEYTILCNLMVSVVAPFYFTFIGVHQDLPFFTSFLMILKRIGTTIALPFFVALFLQLCWKKGNEMLVRFTGATFYIWAFLLFLTLGQTIDYIFIHGKGNGLNILWLGISSVLVCTLNFAAGKWIGSKYGDTIAGGQMLGQKNTAMAIWMANTYLNPLASVFLAFYSVWQNLFNSWQIWRHDKRQSIS